MSLLSHDDASKLEIAGPVGLSVLCLEASPMVAPHLHVADRPACEMISQVKVWSKDPLCFGETMEDMK